MRYVGGWFVLVLAFAVTSAQLNWMDYRTLTRSGSRGEATIVEKSRSDHQLVRYRYEVNGASYESKGQLGAPNAPFSTIRAGDVAVVYYDPEKPQRSVLGDPRTLLANETASVLSFSVLLASAIIAFWYWSLFGRAWQQLRGALPDWIARRS